MRHFIRPRSRSQDVWRLDRIRLAEASGDDEDNDKDVMIIRDIRTGIVMARPIGRKNAADQQHQAFLG